jgi:uncharacterized membrane protein
MSVGRHFRRYMVAGVVTLFPLIVTGLFVYWLDGKAKLLVIELQGRGLPIPDIPVLRLVVSLLATMLIVYLVGILTSNFIGRKFVQMGEAIINHVPIVKSIYTSVKQIADSVSLSQKGLFQKVVLFEYPKKDVWTIGFVTGLAKGEVQRRVPEKRLINIFVPTTPNPTSGYLLMVPEEDLTETRLTVEEAMRIIVSGGIAASADDLKLGETLAVTKEDVEKLVTRRPTEEEKG